MPTINPANGSDISGDINAVSNGETLEIEQGEYEISDFNPSADDFAIIGNGSTVRCVGNLGGSISGNNWEIRGLVIEQNGSNQWNVDLSGANWEFRNIAFVGKPNPTSPLMRIYSPPGSQNLVENIWAGDGYDGRVGESMFRGNCCPVSNEGDTIFRNCYFYQWSCYVAPSAGDGGNGELHFENCYWENPYLAGARIGSNSGTCTVENSVMWVSDASELKETSKGAVASRGFYCWFGQSNINNCHIDTSGSGSAAIKEGKGGSVEVTNSEIVGTLSGDITTSNVGENPSHSPPSGCPTTPSEAVGASVSNGNDTTGEPTHTITIDGGGSVSEYTFTASRGIEPLSGTAAAPVGRTVTDFSTNDPDEYGIYGEVTSFEILQGDPTISLNGTLVNGPQAVIDKTALEPDHTVTIDGAGSTAEYTFTTSKGIKPVSESAVQAFGTTVSDYTTNEPDKYEIFGEITEFEILQGSPVILVDGSEVSGPQAAIDATVSGDTKSPSSGLSVPSAVETGETAVLDASSTTDNVGVVEYRWDFSNDGTIDKTTNSATTTTTYANAGDYTVSVTAVDDAGNTDTSTATLTVTEPSPPDTGDTEPPSPQLTTTGTATVGETVTLDATGSTDNVGIAEYRWDFTGNGTIDRITTSASTEVSYGSAGTYTPTVIAADSAGNTDTATDEINVLAQDDGIEPQLPLGAFALLGGLWVANKRRDKN